ncbi:MAG: beta-L-arabinofuranosidase domain-containing protein [Ferruginibacter sp.]
MMFNQTLTAQTLTKQAFTKIKPIEQAFQPLFFNAIKPKGWLKAELQKNINGFTGHLDSLVPDLIGQDDIYGKNRLSKKDKSKNLGAVSEDGDWQVQFLWWNSETQSNWLDGFVRTAILLNDQQQINKAESIINRLLATQDDDGYIGIYDKELRYRFENENGELWAKATLYRSLLGWYEYKKDKRILTAIEKAVNNVMQQYPINQSKPFYSLNPSVSGLSHGLAFTDVLEQLYVLTKNQLYLDYCLFLYQDFSAYPLNEDAQYDKLMNVELPLQGHGVHTYEHLRSVTVAYYASGNPALKIALDHFLQKIQKALTPSGGPVGNEFIVGQTGDANIAYEYCSLQELMAAWISLFSKSANTNYAQQAERIFFNAALGSTHPTESAICYLKQDNAFILNGGNNGDTTDRHQTRYRYSPIHREAAVCCVPNAGRIVPYYIQNMWMKDEEGLVATLLGPCEVETIFNHTAIMIQEQTDYPFNNAIQFTVYSNRSQKFALKIRKPQWAVKVNASLPYTEENGYLVFRKIWNKRTDLKLSFTAVVEKKVTANNEIYFENGPFVLCHVIEATAQTTKTFNIGNMKEFVCKPNTPIVYDYNGAAVHSVPQAKNSFITQMVNRITGKLEEVKLVPMTKTILRQVTFKNIQ